MPYALRLRKGRRYVRSGLENRVDDSDDVVSSPPSHLDDETSNLFFLLTSLPREEAPVSGSTESRRCYYT